MINSAGVINNNDTSSIEDIECNKIVFHLTGLTLTYKLFIRYLAD